MVSWFHQTELTTVLDLARCEEFRRRLDAHGIPYKVNSRKSVCIYTRGRIAPPRGSACGADGSGPVFSSRTPAWTGNT